MSMLRPREGCIKYGLRRTANYPRCIAYLTCLKCPVSFSDIMVRISVNYQGDLNCEAVHGPSGTTLETDAPTDNQGRGASFSPTDLVATALATCMATTMAIHARKDGLALEGLTITTNKVMSSDPPRRITHLHSAVTFPRGFPEGQRSKYEELARTCPVAQSIHPSIAVPIEFNYT